MKSEKGQDRIFIRDLALRCIIGIYPEERVEKQDVIINIVMTCDCAPAARSDKIEDAVDYKTIKKSILALVEHSKFQLVETLAEEIANLCLANDKVEEVTVTVDKPGALRFARSVAIEITRQKS